MAYQPTTAQNPAPPANQPPAQTPPANQPAPPPPAAPAENNQHGRFRNILTNGRAMVVVVAMGILGAIFGMATWDHKRIAWVVAWSIIFMVVTMLLIWFAQWVLESHEAASTPPPPSTPATAPAPQTPPATPPPLPQAPPSPCGTPPVGQVFLAPGGVYMYTPDGQNFQRWDPATNQWVTYP